MRTLLRVIEVSSGYGSIEVLRGISLDVSEGTFVAVLGPNGAGKTTLLRTVSGLLRVFRGQILFYDSEITQLKPYHIVSLGIAHVPEGRRIFSGMTVLENLLLGAHTRKDKANVNRDLSFVLDLFPELQDCLHRLGSRISGGQQQMLAIGRALMTRPKLLLLDEPSLGLAPVVTARLAQALRQLREEWNLSCLLAEQQVALALQLSDFIYVIRNGQVQYSSPSREVDINRLRSLYLSD